MTRRTRNRLIAYPIAVLACGVLLYLGFVHQGEPEIGTILNGADVLSKVGAHDQAIVECEKVLERDPGNLQAHLIYACSLDRLGRHSEAIERYRRALTISTDRSIRLEIRLSIADLERRSGDVDVAIRDCESIVADHGPTSRASLVRGFAHAACGEVDAADASFREAVALEPELALAQYSLGCFYLENGRPNEALAAFETVRSLERGLKAAFPSSYRIAQARVALADCDGALQALDESSQTWRGFTKQHLPDDPAFDALRAHPGFEALLADLVAGDSRRS